MVERVMILDAILGDRRRWWLSPADDKWKFFCLMRDNYLRPEDYPHIAFGSGRQRRFGAFPTSFRSASRRTAPATWCSSTS